MHPATLKAFVDEFTKIAAKPAREANNLMGLPATGKPKPGSRRWETDPLRPSNLNPAAGLAPDSQSMDQAMTEGHAGMQLSGHGLG